MWKGFCDVSCTWEVEGEGYEAVVFAENTEGLLSLHQTEEVVSHRLAVEEVVNAQQEVPAGQELGE